jgi:hypothetical protein
MGIEFLDIDEGKRTRIAAFVDRLKEELPAPAEASSRQRTS